MIRFRPFDLSRDWAWFNVLNPVLRVEDTCGVVAYRIETGERLGAVILDSFSNSSVQCHMNITNPICLKHGMLQHVTDFVFNVCDLDFMIGQVPSNNKKALKLNKKIGFKEFTRIKNGYDRGVDMVMVIMDKSECNYYEKPKVEVSHG